MVSFLIYRQAVVITAGTYISSAWSYYGPIPQMLQMPAVWDAADISFATSPDGVNFYFLYDSAGLAVSLPAAANRRIVLPTSLIGYTRGLKITSGIPGVPVNQVADRTLYLEYWS